MTEGTTLRIPVTIRRLSAGAAAEERIDGDYVAESEAPGWPAGEHVHGTTPTLALRRALHVLSEAIEVVEAPAPTVGPRRPGGA